MATSVPRSSRPTPRRSNISNAAIGTAIRYIVLILLAFLFLLPFWVIVRNGLAAETDITSFHWNFFPSSLHFENLAELFNDPSVPILGGLQTSATVAILQTIGQILLSALAAYGLARVPYRWADLVFYFVLITLLIPSTIIFVPTYVIVSYLGWVSTLQGLVVPGLFSAFTTFLFRQFFISFPRELEEAGHVDGLGHWGVFWRIVVPNSWGIIAALAVITFIASWNSFLWPLVIGQSSDSYTIQVVLSNFLNAQVLNLHELFIGTAVAILPLVVVFFVLQRYIVEGYKQSGVKG